MRTNNQQEGSVSLPNSFLEALTDWEDSPWFFPSDRGGGEVLGTVETDAFENSEEQSVLLSALFLSQVRPHVQRSQVPFDLPTNLPWVFFSNAPHTECSVSNIFVDFS